MKSQVSIQKKIKIFFIIIIACLAFSAAVMWLWNAILPEVIGVKTISFIQAFGILVLSKILFGGFRGGGWAAHKRGRWMEMQEKMATMSPEEREKFKSEWKSRCGHRWRTDATNTNTSTTE
jgi:heme A synthase